MCQGTNKPRLSAHNFKTLLTGPGPPSTDEGKVITFIFDAQTSFIWVSIVVLSEYSSAKPVLCQGKNPGYIESIGMWLTMAQVFSYCLEDRLVLIH